MKGKEPPPWRKTFKGSLDQIQSDTKSRAMGADNDVKVILLAFKKAEKSVLEVGRKFMGEESAMRQFADRQLLQLEDEIKFLESLEAYP